MASKSPMISRRWLINYVLILLIVVFTYIGNKYKVETGYQPGNRITQLKAQDVTSIAIQTADSSLKLSKVEGNWQIDSPIIWYANNIAAERIIDIVNAQTDSRLPSNEIDLSTLGLQFPKAILKLNEKQFLFGATNNIGERRYLQIDDTVYLLKDRYLPFILQGLNGLLDRRLLSRSLSLQSLTVAEMKINRGESGDWLSENKNLSSEQANQIINNWQKLEANRIQAYQSRQTPKQKAVALLEQGGKIEFYILTITPELIIARPDIGLQYHFNESSYYGLMAAPKDEVTTN